MVKNEISINIDKLISDILPEQKYKALDKAGTIVQNEAKIRCGVKTGTLRNSILHVTDETSTIIGSGVEYAAYHHNKNKFLQDAMDQNMDRIKECFTEIFKGGAL